MFVQKTKRLRVFYLPVEKKIMNLYISFIYTCLVFLKIFVNMEKFTKIENKTVYFGSVSSVSLDNGCHFCTCLVRCTEDVHCVGVETNKIRTKCKLMLQDNSTRNVHALKNNINYDVYVTTEFDEYGKNITNIIRYNKNIIHKRFI